MMILKTFRLQKKRILSTHFLLLYKMGIENIVSAVVLYRLNKYSLIIQTATNYNSNQINNNYNL